jgi:hypothetical protein
MQAGHRSGSNRQIENGSLPVDEQQHFHLSASLLEGASPLLNEPEQTIPRAKGSSAVLPQAVL